VSETVKEKIKRKKKERSKEVQNSDSQEEPTIEKATTIPQKTTGKNEVLGIYPSTGRSKKKFVVQGHVSIKMHPLGIEVRNIPYAIKADHTVRTQAPFRYHKFPEEPGRSDEYIETLKFDNKSLWEDACETIKAAVLKHHKDDLPPIDGNVSNAN